MTDKVLSPRDSTPESEQGLTPWLDGSIAPVHVGPYKRRFPAGPYSCWDGRRWLGDSATVAGAASSTSVSAMQSAPWRGTTTQAEEPCLTCGGHGVIDDGSPEVSGFAPLQPCPDC